MNTFDLLDLVIEDSTTITIFSIDTGEDLMRGVSVETAKEFFSKADNLVICSIEVDNGTLCLNVEEMDD